MLCLKRVLNKNRAKEIPKKRILDIDESAWKLLKCYAALKGLNIGKAIEDIINSNKVIKELKKVSNSV